MKTIITKISFCFIFLCCSVGLTFAQTFCLQLTEVSNDGTDLVVRVEMQASAALGLADANLQFAYDDASLGTPTLASSPLAPPVYFIPTVTTPAPGSASVNIVLPFPGTGSALAVAPAWFEIAQISFPIINGSAIGAFSWEYNGGTTQTVAFGDDAVAPFQVFATSAACLTGYTPAPVASAPDCPTLLTPADGAVDVSATGGVALTWSNAATGGAPTAINVLFGTDPLALSDLGDVGIVEAINITGVDFLTTYYWSIVPSNATGAATGCDVFELTTEVTPAGGTNISCGLATPIGEGTFTDLGPLNGAGASLSCFPGTAATNASWYAYTATITGTATISSSIDLDEPDTRVSVLSDCTALTCLASDDDSGAGFTSIASLEVVAGQTYYIEWDDRWDAGEFDFEIVTLAALDGCIDATACNYNDQATNDDGSCIYPTGCDTCSGETDGSGTVVAGPNVGDACDDGDPATTGEVIGADCICAVQSSNDCGGSLVAVDGVQTSAGILALGGGIASNACFTGTPADSAIWYSYVATATDSIVVSSSIDLDQPDTRVSIHSDCGSLDCIGSDDDGGEGFTSIAVFAAVAGETYYIEWDNRWDSGEFDFEIRPLVSGCTDATACNYNDGADSDDGTCIFADPATCDTCSGETDGTGTVVDNPEEGTACDDGDPTTVGDVIGADCVCLGSPTTGCTDMTACNYNSFAVTDDGSCIFADPATCDSCSGETDGSGTVVDNPEVGEACDDGDATTGNDIVGADCVCAGSVGPNPTCATAIAVGDGITTSPGIVGGGGATNACFTTATNAVWYVYTASCTGFVTVSSSIDLDEPDTRVSVHSDCTTLDCIASDDDGGAGFTSIATFESVAGEDYYIEWDDRWDTGEFDFEISCAVAIPGCLDALACNYNMDANVDDLSCTYAAGCDTCSGETDGTGVVIDNPEIGEACDDGDANTTNDTVQGDCTCVGDPLTACTDATACNYDDDPAVGTDNTLCIYATGCDTCSGATDGSGTVVDNPEIGEACDDGDVTTINDVIGPDCGTCTGVLGTGPGTSCANAITVTDGITTSIGTDAIGGGGASNTCFTGTPAVNAIWYSYTALVCDTVTVSSSIDLDEPDTRVSIYESCDSVGVACLASDDDGGEGFTSITTFVAEAGTTYYIEWDDRWDGGEFDFEISTPADTCPTDLDNDGDTDGDDFSIFLGNFGLDCPTSCPCETDFNFDLTTDGDDFSIFLGNFGLSCD